MASSDPTDSDGDIATFVCTVKGCRKVLKSRWSLKRHSRLHTGVRPYLCEICFKTFVEKCGLDRHFATHSSSNSSSSSSKSLSRDTHIKTLSNNASSSSISMSSEADSNNINDINNDINNNININNVMANYRSLIKRQSECLASCRCLISDPALIQAIDECLHDTQIDAQDDGELVVEVDSGLRRSKRKVNTANRSFSQQDLVDIVLERALNP